jgi:hypothetical protein
MVKPKPRREQQLSPDGVQRIYKATLAYGCLVLSWSGIESGIRSFTAQETRNLQQFLEKYKKEIGTKNDPISDKENP